MADSSVNPTDQLLSLLNEHWPGIDHLAEVQNPDWPERMPWGDWREYVENSLRVLWPHLTLEARLACYWSARWLVAYEGDPPGL